jgi:hypothetical protein
MQIKYPPIKYAGWLALSCVIAAPFVANQWLKFAKAQHAYQAQLQAENAPRTFTKEEIEAWANDSPMAKQWKNFGETVQVIKQHNKDNDWQRNHAISDSQCDQLAAIIRRRDIKAFNSFVGNLTDDQKSDLKYSYPDLSDPNLTAEDVKELSQFIKP